MKKTLRFLPFILVFSIIFIMFQLNYKKRKNEIEGKEIQGIIESIKYDSKKYVIIKLLKNKQEFSLEYFGINILDNLEVQDSIYKNKNSQELSHFKKDKNNVYQLYRKHNLIN